MNNNNYCVIMAGGIGSRFWPLSTSHCPKQFLDPMGIGKSFIQSTFERFLPIIPKENFLVVTSQAYKEKVLEHLPEISEHQVLLEPLRRNTAPCIEYAAWRILTLNPNANMVVAPADHLITNEAEFTKIISEALEFVNNSNNLLTIGIKPSHPETGYGYIQFDPLERIQNINRVKTFTEKPNLDLAQVFVDSGEFLWNSGIFIWSVQGIQNAFKELLPEIYEQFAQGKELFNTDKEQQFIDNLYPQCENISIDYGIMEKSKIVYTRAADFGWSDVGTWGALYTHMNKDVDGNATMGNVLTYDTQNTIVSVSKNKNVIIQGLDNYLVIERDQNILICKRDDEQSIKNWVDDLKIKNYNHKA